MSAHPAELVDAEEGFYTGEPRTMAALKEFLNENIGEPLHFVCQDTSDEIFEYTDRSERG